MPIMSIMTDDSVVYNRDPAAPASAGSYQHGGSQYDDDSCSYRASSISFSLLLSPSSSCRRVRGKSRKRRLSVDNNGTPRLQDPHSMATIEADGHAPQGGPGRRSVEK